MPEPAPRRDRRGRRRPPGGGPERGEGRALRTAPFRARGGAVSPTTVALLSEEEAGRIATVCAGVVSLRASLRGRDGERVLPPALPEPRPRVSLRAFGDDEDGETHRLSLELCATSRADLAASTDDLLRALSAHAALAGAVLETRVLSLAGVFVPQAPVVGRLARDLFCSGLRVGFGRSPVPAPEGARICVGAAGREQEIKSLLQESPAWRPVFP